MAVYLDSWNQARCTEFDCLIVQTCEHVRCNGKDCHYTSFCEVCSRKKDCGINIFEELKKGGYLR